MRLERDVRDGDLISTQITADPSPDDLDDAVFGLDQHRHTEMALVADDGQFIAVEGGRGRYYVYIGADGRDDTIVAQRPDAGDGHEDLMVGGQLRTVPLRHLVGFVEAVRAVRTFASDGRADGNLAWAPR